MVPSSSLTASPAAAAANAVSEGPYAEAKTSIWWDIENCAVPRSCDPNRVVQNMSSALAAAGYTGPVTISAYGNTGVIPHVVQNALYSTGINLHHVPPGIKDASDKKILVDMFIWAIENPPPANYMLISGDRDFCNALHKLSLKRYNILLAQPPNVSQSLVAAAKSVWLWKSFAAGEPPLAVSPYVCSISNGRVSTLDMSEKATSYGGSFQVHSQVLPNSILESATSEKTNNWLKDEQASKCTKRSESNAFVWRAVSNADHAVDKFTLSDLSEPKNVTQPPEAESKSEMLVASGEAPLAESPCLSSISNGLGSSSLDSLEKAIFGLQIDENINSQAQPNCSVHERKRDTNRKTDMWSKDNQANSGADQSGSSTFVFRALKNADHELDKVPANSTSKFQTFGFPNEALPPSTSVSETPVDASSRNPFKKFSSLLPQSQKATTETANVFTKKTNHESLLSEAVPVDPSNNATGSQNAGNPNLLSPTLKPFDNCFSVLPELQKTTTKTANELTEEANPGSLLRETVPNSPASSASRPQIVDNSNQALPPILTPETPNNTSSKNPSTKISFSFVLPPQKTTTKTTNACSKKTNTKPFHGNEVLPSDHVPNTGAAFRVIPNRKIYHPTHQHGQTSQSPGVSYMRPDSQNFLQKNICPLNAQRINSYQPTMDQVDPSQITATCGTASLPFTAGLPGHIADIRAPRISECQNGPRGVAPSFTKYHSGPPGAAPSISEYQNGTHGCMPPFQQRGTYFYNYINVQSGSVQCPPFYGVPPPPPLAPPPNMFSDKRWHNAYHILQALSILKREKLAPTEENIADCIHYGDINLPCLDVKMALANALGYKLLVSQLMRGNVKIYIPKNDAKWNYVNLMDASVKYPEEVWDTIYSFLSSSDGHAAILSSKCRYHAASIFKKMCLSKFVLGEVLQMLHIVITVKRWIVPHSSGWQPISINTLATNLEAVETAKH